MSSFLSINSPQRRGSHQNGVAHLGSSVGAEPVRKHRNTTSMLHFVKSNSKCLVRAKVKKQVEPDATHKHALKPVQQTASNTHARGIYGLITWNNYFFVVKFSSLMHMVLHDGLGILRAGFLRFFGMKNKS